MKSRNRKLISLILSAVMVLSFNTVSFAEEVPATDVLTGQITLLPAAPKLQVNADSTVEVERVKSAIIGEMVIKAGGVDYYIKGKDLIRKSDDKVVSTNSLMDESISVNLIGIRRAGAALKDAKDISYDSESKNYIKDVRGNQLINYTATVNKGVLPKAESREITGDAFLTVCMPSVSTQRVLFGDGKYALRVDYDSAVEFRGNKITATSHFMAGGDNPPNGEVDGAVGVAVRLEKVSGNLFLPLDDKEYTNVPSENIIGSTSFNKAFEKYFWQSNTGITLKRPAIKRAKKIAAYYEDSAPYFTIPMKLSKKTIEGDVLTTNDKQDLKNKLASTKFYFTIQPRQFCDSLITYSKNEPDKYYVNKLTYNTTNKKLTGTVQYRANKKNKNTLNARGLKNVGKKLKFCTKSAYDSNGSVKSDVYFEYDSDRNGIMLTGINGYYGSAFITRNIIVK